MFTFGEQENDIGRVFNGDYLQLVSDQWVTVNNYQPFTVSSTSCTVVYVHNMSYLNQASKDILTLAVCNVLHEVFKNTNLCFLYSSANLVAVVSTMLKTFS